MKKLGENEEYNSQLVKRNHVRDLQHRFSQIPLRLQPQGEDGVTVAVETGCDDARTYQWDTNLSLLSLT